MMQRFSIALIAVCVLYCQPGCSLLKSDEDQLRDRIEADLTANRDVFVRRANQLAMVKAKCDEIVTGEASILISPEQLAAFSELELRFVSEPNAAWIRSTDLMAIVADAVPAEMTDKEEAGLKEFKAWDYEYETSQPRRLASYAHGDVQALVDEDARYSSKDPERETFAKKSADAWRGIEYAVVIRPVNRLAGEPIKKDDEWSFRSGYWGAEVLVFKMETAEWIAAFDFEACNRGTRDVYGLDDKQETLSIEKIRESLGTDLRRNVWPAFWQALDQRCNNRFGKYTAFDLQYDEASLQNARLLFVQKMMDESPEEAVPSFIRRKILAGEAAKKNR